MSKRKKTPQQIKAAKKRKYQRRAYQETLDALQFISEMIKPISFKPAKNVTSKTLATIRKKYKQIKAQLKVENYILPTKKEMATVIRSERIRAKTADGDVMSNDPMEEYIEDIKGALNSLRPMKPTDHSDTYYVDKLLPKFEEAKSRVISALDYAVMKAGETEVASILAGNDFISRITNLQEKYTHEIIDSIDDDLIPLIETAVTKALENI